VVLLAWLSFVLDVSEYLSLQFFSAMGEAALVSKLAVTSQLPVFAHFGLVLSLVLLYELSTFLRIGEPLSLWAHIDLEV